MSSMRSNSALSPYPPSMSILWHLRLTLVAVFLGRVDAKLLSSTAELTNYIYDFVIVGGKSGICHL